MKKGLVFANARNIALGVATIKPVAYVIEKVSLHVDVNENAQSTVCDIELILSSENAVFEQNASIKRLIQHQLTLKRKDCKSFCSVIVETPNLERHKKGEHMHADC